MYFTDKLLSLNSKLATQRFGYPLHEDVDFWFDHLPGTEGSGYDTYGTDVTFEDGVFYAQTWAADPDAPDFEQVTVYYGPCPLQQWEAYVSDWWKDYLADSLYKEVTYLPPA